MPYLFSTYLSILDFLMESANIQGKINPRENCTRVIFQTFSITACKHQMT